MPLKLPKGKKCAVCLTFDFDAISLWAGTFGTSSPVAVSRGEFGARVGVPRILELLDKYGIKATFFVPGHTADTFPEVTKLICEKGHEIGHHGYCHESPVNMKYEDEVKVLEKGVNSLKKVIGEAPKGYRSPDWDISQNTIDILLDHGFIYDSSLMRQDFNAYKCRRGDKVHTDRACEFGEETNLIEIPASWDMDDFPPFEPYETQQHLSPGLSAPSAVFEIWSGNFDYMYRYVKGGIYILTCHPQVIGRGHRILMLDKLIRYIRKHPGVWFARVIDVAKTWID